MRRLSVLSAVSFVALIFVRVALMVETRRVAPALRPGELVQLAWIEPSPALQVLNAAQTVMVVVFLASLCALIIATGVALVRRFSG